MTGVELPALEPGEFGWEGRVVLPSWAAFSARGDRAATDTFHLSVDRKDGQTAPTPAQVAAYRHLIANEKLLGVTALNAILEEADPFGVLDAELEEIGDLKGRIALGTVYILSEERDGVAYVGFGGACEWDEEHDFGVMMHLDRVVACGQGADAFEGWIAREDAEKA